MMELFWKSLPGSSSTIKYGFYDLEIMDVEILCLDIINRNENICPHKNLYISDNIALFTISQNGNNPNVYQWINATKVRMFIPSQTHVQI
jgi:hypothetical protein